MFELWYAIAIITMVATGIWIGYVWRGLEEYIQTTNEKENNNANEN
jgi:hypothetical protein